MGCMRRNGAGWLGKKRELGRWRRKNYRMTGHGRAELRVHIGAFSNFYITLVNSASRTKAKRRDE